jgi:outer membrane protein OmpA-like peptidoglycan-associated protein
MTPSGGRPVEPGVRASAERAYGRDLSDVRIHTDAEAAEQADALRSRAYTAGRDIVFAAGAYDPESAEGQHLIAHELAHVVQQSAGTAPGVGSPSDSFEGAADRAADSAMRGEPARLDPSGPAPALQRQGLSLKTSPLMARAMGSGTIDSFVTGKATLDSSQTMMVDVIAASILSLRATDYPGCSVSVTGHTDAVGAETNNMALGQARADAVRDELVKKGVPVEIIMTSSAGESQLKVPTEAAEPKNRRAEIQFEPEPRFHLGGILNPPTAAVQPPAAAADAPPPVLPPPLIPRRDVLDPDAAERDRRIFGPIPADPTKTEGPPQPLLKPFVGKLDDLLEQLHVPQWARGPIKDAAISGIVKGVSGAADAAMKSAGMNSMAQDAVNAAIDAAIKSQTP